MLTPARLLTALSFTLAVTAATVQPLPPALQGLPWDPATALVPDDTTTTDADTIASTAQVVDQKSGAAGDSVPDQPIPDTVVTATDGTLTDAGTGSGNDTTTSSRRWASPEPFTPTIYKRQSSNYEQVFSGTGTGPNDRDGSIEGTAYLTFTLVDNSTYNIAACQSFCDGIETCVFVNLYYEFNNPGLDAASSNLKCAAYADTHSAAEKTNRGGQQLAPLPAGLTFIQQSSGFSSATLVDPADPEGYELVFGPVNGANNAPGYMGFAFLDRYDVDACAAQCNTRGADGQGGACQFFNIWRAVVNGNPTTYTCSMYFIVADVSTAVNTGQGDLKVTFSRGYRRKNLAIDGGFEAFAECDDFCFDTSSPNWVGTSPAGGTLDATIFFFQPFAHTGNAVALLGSATGVDALPGTLTPKKPIATVAGKQYSINFFQNSAFSSPTLEAPAFVDILWNGQIVTTIRPGFTNFKFFSVTVTAKGNDVLAFHGGAAPAWSFIDDITIFEQ